MRGRLHRSYPAQAKIGSDVSLVARHRFCRLAWQSLPRARLQPARRMIQPLWRPMSKQRPALQEVSTEQAVAVERAAVVAELSLPGKHFPQSANPTCSGSKPDRTA